MQIVCLACEPNQQLLDKVRKCERTEKGSDWVRASEQTKKWLKTQCKRNVHCFFYSYLFMHTWQNESEIEIETVAIYVYRITYTDIFVLCLQVLLGSMLLPINCWFNGRFLYIKHRFCFNKNKNCFLLLQKKKKKMNSLCSRKKMIEKLNLINCRRNFDLRTVTVTFCCLVNNIFFWNVFYLETETEERISIFDEQWNWTKRKRGLAHGKLFRLYYKWMMNSSKAAIGKSNSNNWIEWA